MKTILKLTEHLLIDLSTIKTAELFCGEQGVAMFFQSVRRII